MRNHVSREEQIRNFRMLIESSKQDKREKPIDISQAALEKTILVTDISQTIDGTILSPTSPNSPNSPLSPNENGLLAKQDSCLLDQVLD